ncbi:hypothetical protein DOY81_014094 [Sarcophaga bullata]|nr:hypothetical protein DOY81_014094 [Sarcophaga bullata]
MNKKERLTYVIEKIDLDLVNTLRIVFYVRARLILKESDESIPAAKRHMKIMWCVDKFVKGMWLFGIIYVIYRYFFADYFTTTTVSQPLESF